MKLKYLLFGLILVVVLSFINPNTYAKTMSPDEIQGPAYVIGSHVFTRDTDETTGYEGRLTTKLIMLASQTIGSSDMDNLIIYYKTASGTWIDSLTGEKINVPTVFNIDYINQKVSNASKYGDVNNDGKINTTDTILISRYIATGEVTSNFNVANADVNGDGKVNIMDEVLLRKYIAGNYSDKNLPDEPLGQTYYIEYVIENNNTFNTYNIDYELKDHVIYNNQKPEEPTKKGYTFDGWYFDTEYKEKFEFDKTKITKNIVLYAKFTKINYGDADNDGNITTGDATLILQYVDGTTPTGINLANADVNGDGKVTKADAVLIMKYVVGKISNVNLPDEPLGTTYSIEYKIEEDGVFDTLDVDYGLENYVVYEPNNLIRKGFTLDGWYLDKYYKEKFEFNKTKLTNDLVLYGKYIKIKYGDADNDGEITTGDATLILQYVAGTTPTGINLANADVNGDGEVTKADAVLIMKYVVGKISDVNLPDEPLGTTYSIEYKIEKENGTFKTLDVDYGLENYAVYEPNNLTREGYTIDGWYLDEKFEEKFEFGTTKLTSNLVLYGKYIKINYGDANNDGKITTVDATLILQYVAGENPSDINLANADVNGDGKVTEADAILISKYYVGEISDVNLPDEPLGTTYSIEYKIEKENGTFKTLDVDYGLENYVVYEQSELTKEGYTLDGWYLDEEFKEKFEFGTTKLTSNLILYGKYIKN